MPLADMILQSRRTPALLDVVVLFVVTTMTFAAADNWDGLLDKARAYILGRVVRARRRTLRVSAASNTDGRAPPVNSNSSDPASVSTIDQLDDKALRHLGVDIDALDEREEEDDELDEANTGADPELEALLDSLRTMLAQNPDDTRRQHLQRALDELTTAGREASQPAPRVDYVEHLDRATPLSPSMLGRGRLISGTPSAPGSPFAFAGRSPLLTGRSPMLGGLSPFVLAGSPLLSGRSPLLSGRSPLLSGRSPLLAGRSPLLSGRSPLISSGLGVGGIISPRAPPSAFGLPPSLPELTPLTLPAQLQPFNEPTWQEAAGPSSLLLELGASKPTSPVRPGYFDAPRSAGSDEPSHGTRPPTPPLDDPAMFFRTLLMSPPRRPPTRTTTSSSLPQVNSLPSSAGLDNSMLFSTESSIPRLQAVDMSLEAMSSSMRATLPQQSALFGATEDTDAHVWWSDEDEDEPAQRAPVTEDPSSPQDAAYPVSSPPLSIDISTSAVDVLPGPTFDDVSPAEQFHPVIDQSPVSLPTQQSGPWPSADLHISAGSECSSHGAATSPISPDTDAVFGENDPDSADALSPMTFAPPSPSAVRLAESISLFPEVASWPTSSPRTDEDDASDSDSIVSSPPSPLDLDTIEEERHTGFKEARLSRARESLLLAAAVSLPSSPISASPAVGGEGSGAVASSLHEAALSSSQHIGSTTSETPLPREGAGTSNDPALAEVVETSRPECPGVEQLPLSPSFAPTATEDVVQAEIAHSSSGSSTPDSPELVNSPPTAVSSDDESLDGLRPTTQVLASLPDVVHNHALGSYALHDDAVDLCPLEVPAGPDLGLQPPFELDIFSPSADKGVSADLSPEVSTGPDSAALLSPLQLRPHTADDFSPRGAFERLRAHLPSPEARPHDVPEEPVTPDILTPTVDAVARPLATPSPLQLDDSEERKVEFPSSAQPQPTTPNSAARTLTILVPPVSPRSPPSRPSAPTPRRSSRMVQSHKDVILEEDEEDTMEFRRGHASPRPTQLGSPTASLSGLSDRVSNHQRESTAPDETWLADLGEDKFDLPDASKLGLSPDRESTPQPSMPESIDAVPDCEMDDTVSSLHLEDDSDTLASRQAETQTPPSDASPTIELTSPDDMRTYLAPTRSLAERRMSFPRDDIPVPASRVLIPAPPRQRAPVVEQDVDEDGNEDDEGTDSDTSEPGPLSLDQLLEEVFPGATPEVHPVIDPRIPRIPSVEFRRSSADGSIPSESIVQRRLSERQSFDHKASASVSSEHDSRDMSIESGYGYDWRRPSEADEVEEEQERWRDSVRFPSAPTRPGASIDSDRPSNSLNAGESAPPASSTLAKPRGRSRGRTKSGRFIARVLDGLKPKSSKRDSTLSLKLENASTVSLAPSTSGWTPSESLAALDAAFPVTAPASEASTSSTKESRKRATRNRTVSLFSSLSAGGSSTTIPDSDTTPAQDTSRLGKARSFLRSGKGRKSSESVSDLSASQLADTQPPGPLLHAHSDPLTVPSLERRTSASPLNDGSKRSRTMSVFSTLSSRSGLSRGYTESADKSGLPRRESVQSFVDSDQGRHQKTRSGSSGASVSNYSISRHGSSPAREGTVGWGDLVRPRPVLRSHSLVRSRSPSPARSSREHDSSTPSRRGSMTPHGAQSPTRRASMSERLDDQYRRSASRERRMSISNVAKHGPSFVELRGGSNSVRRRTLSAGAVDGSGKRRSISWSKSALELAREEEAAPAVPPLPERRQASTSDIPAEADTQPAMKPRTQRPRPMSVSLGWPSLRASSSTPAAEAPLVDVLPQSTAPADDTAKSKPKDRGRSRLVSLTSRFSRK